jgi:hypothetical protein
MKNIETILRTIERELIRTYAVLDAWFDEEPGVLQYLPAGGGRCCSEMLEQLMHTNGNLLSSIEMACREAHARADETAVADITDWSHYTLLEAIALERCMHTLYAAAATQTLSHDDVRSRMRIQLGICLEHLDTLCHGEGTRYKTTLPMQEPLTLDVYQHLYFLAHFGRSHVARLEENKAEFALLGRNLN